MLTTVIITGDLGPALRALSAGVLTGLIWWVVRKGRQRTAAAAFRCITGVPAFRFEVAPS